MNSGYWGQEVKVKVNLPYKKVDAGTMQEKPKPPDSYREPTPMPINHGLRGGHGWTRIYLTSFHSGLIFADLIGR